MDQNLRYLLLIRTFAIAGQALALACMHGWFGVLLPLGEVAVILLVLSGLTLVSWRRHAHTKRAQERVFIVQLFADVAALAALVYVTGGSINPFVSLFILPIVFAAASMRPWPTTLVTLVAVGAYTGLMFFHRSLPGEHALHGDVQLHLWGMWYGFVLSAILVAYFVSRIARTLRSRDRALAAAREHAIRAERLVELGTLAAGTAHELGTPLATIAVIAGELEAEHRDDPNLGRSLRTLRDQVDRCRDALARLAFDAGELRADCGAALGIEEFFDAVVADWQALRPDVDVRYARNGPLPAPRVVVDRTLRQAIVNVLNNAADASVARVEIEGHWSAETLTLAVRDDGPGLSGEAQAHAGHTPYSGKPPGDGLGIGLLLAHSTLARLGGRIDFVRGEHGGTCARIEIPTRVLLAA